MKLFIVESPTKAKTLRAYLGKDFLVLATMGHILDLPKNRLGVDVENEFKIDLEVLPKKGKLVTEILSKMKVAEIVYIATDPDREGEGIASHLLNFKVPKVKVHRVRLKEITKEELNKELKKKESINQFLVNSQEARRVLDRILGFGLSPELWHVKKNLSAGRVQSVVLKWICERETEIRNFKPEIYYELFLETKEGLKFYLQENKEKKKFISLEELKKIFPKELTNSKEISIGQKNFSNKEILLISDTKKKNINRYPPMPHTTASLQKEASQVLGFSPEKTMRIASELFEGVETSSGRNGIITYPRTDSVRVSEETKQKVKKILTTKGFEFKDRKSKLAKNKVQDAHEAIRPSNLMLSPNDLDKVTKDEKNLYKLIYDRVITSFMAEAVYEENKIFGKWRDLDFLCSFERLVSAGYLAWKNQTTENKQNSSIQVGDRLELESYSIEEKTTKPKERFTEALLIDKMEKSGVGRPSTYAPTILTLLKRIYITIDKKIIYPTELGEEVNSVISNKFPNFVSDEYTKQMEEELDKIESGEISKLDFLNQFYKDFLEKRKEAKSVFIKRQAKRICPKCEKGVLMNKVSREKKAYELCSRFPDCDFMQYRT
ncbi:MAG: type I DNA topoisomerase [Leptospiraceae bacterium]|nr:type I DNA topoisomerase [Leptospiraceae bacterium]